MSYLKVYRGPMDDSRKRLRMRRAILGHYLYFCLVPRYEFIMVKVPPRAIGYVRAGRNGYLQSYIVDGVHYQVVDSDRIPQDHVLGDFYSECLTCARMAEEISPPNAIYILMSGGIDSEAAAYSFLKAKVPFKAAIMRMFWRGELMNDYDIKHATFFCGRNGVSMQFFDLDLGDFYFGGKYLDYARQFLCDSPQLCTHLWLMDQIDGVPVLGGTVPGYRQAIPSALSFLYFCYERYFDLRGRPGVFNFFHYSPFLFQAGLKLARKLDQQVKKAKDEYHAKVLLLQNGGIDVNPKPGKFTGFEKFKTAMDIHVGDQVSYDKLFRYPLWEIIPQAERNLFLFDKSDFSLPNAQPSKNIKNAD